MSFYDDHAQQVATLDINDIESVDWYKQCYQLTPEASKKIDSLKIPRGWIRMVLDNAEIATERFNVVPQPF